MKAILDFTKPLTLLAEDNAFQVYIDFSSAFRDGADGYSAYEIAVQNGFIGTEVQWLLTLIGDEGPQGPVGATGGAGGQGADGADGMSAYEIAVAEGFIGTEAQWLDSLEGISFIWRGTWAVSTEYLLNDVVEYLGSSYICTVETNADVLPDALTHWELVAEKGDTGATGPSGILTTTSAIALSTETSESLAGDIELHKVAKTGTYTDLISTPDLTVYVPYSGATTNVDLNDKQLVNVDTLGVGTATPNNNIQVINLIDFNNLKKTTKLGFESGKNNSVDATNNTFIGYQAGYSTAGSSSLAVDNTAIGCLSLFTNTTGNSNTSIGNYSLRYNETGNNNTAIGNLALNQNQTGISNSAIGHYALRNNTTGMFNTAVGAESLYANVGGVFNTAIGFSALSSNADSVSNTAIGYNSLYNNVSGASNTAVGSNSLHDNQTSHNNVSIGDSSLYATTGTGNIGIGTNMSKDITSGTYNTIIGTSPSNGTGITTGAKNTIIGSQISGLSNPSNNIIIADGDGNIQIQDDGTNLTVSNNIVVPTAHIGGVANYSSFEADGTLLFNGDATVWDDLRIIPGSFERPGVADPVYVNYIPTGSTLGIYLPEFAKDDFASFQVQLPHSYKQGSVISVHIHWTPGLRGSEEPGALVGWKVDYVWANIDGTFGVVGTADLSDACDGTDDKHQMTASVDIIGNAGKNISSMLLCNIRRTDAGADDTWAGTISGQLPLLLEVDFHYEMDTIGSRTISSK